MSLERRIPLLLCIAMLGQGKTLAADLCTTGLRQSPIDITQPQPARLPALRFAYQAKPFQISRDDRALRVRISPGSALHRGNERLPLTQFHFHTPGGEHIAGQSFPFSVHLLHKSASGQLVVVVILFQLGAPNPLLDQLLRQIPERPGSSRTAADPLDLTQLLPNHLGYFRYLGSLTDTPCTEGVEWLVMKEAMTISAQQLALYRTHFADNMRPVQPLNGRIVEETP